ncbi:MAG TPA: ABC transporter ATP-binding protein, partial [candidate division Zixibacteria bacterium]|nr:ABC transporter ATP-binding protein [candidate division Zixibacteria bacterium]
VTVNGRLSALLELGSGFNYEFTGRENVTISCALMGLTREETNARMEDILAFANIGEFIDQPIKTYSSGMVIRLAFAVSICVDPDIFIVDEALAVGDVAFQRKCFMRLQEIKEKGATILFVTHSPDIIVEFCDRAFLLEHGELLLSGDPQIIVSKYQQLVYAAPDRQESLREEIRNLNASLIPEPISEPDGNEEFKRVGTQPSVGVDYYDPDLIAESTISYEHQGAQIENSRILTTDGNQVNVLKRGVEYIYCYDVRFYQPATAVRFGMAIKTTSGFELGGSSTSTLRDAIKYVDAGSNVSVSFRFRALLSPGVYFINAGSTGIRDGEPCILHRIIDAIVFRIEYENAVPLAGIVDFGIKPTVKINSPTINHEDTSIS